MTERFVRCSECNEVHNFSLHDDTPEYVFSEKKSQYSKNSMSDGKSFLIKHQGHTLQELHKKGECFIEGKTYNDPMKNVYYNVTNGIEMFILKKSRSDAGAPVSFELSAGTFSVTQDGPVFDLDKIGKVISHPRWGNSFLHNHSEEFFNTLKDLSSEIRFSHLDNSSVLETSPEIRCCRLPGKIIEKLVRNLSRLLSRELPRDAVEFINDQKDFGGCLNPLFRRKLQIADSGGAFTVKTETDLPG